MSPLPKALAHCPDMAVSFYTLVPIANPVPGFSEVILPPLIFTLLFLLQLIFCLLQLIFYRDVSYGHLGRS